jgi:hypothetical protein
MAGFDEIAGDGGTHGPETDETDVHTETPKLKRFDRAAYIWRHRAKARMQRAARTRQRRRFAATILAACRAPG